MPQTAVRAPRPRRVAASPWTFAVLYLGWAYLWWTPVLRSETPVWSGTNLMLFLIGGASPLLAAAVLAWWTGGRAGLADLARRLVAIRGITRLWLLVLLGFWLVFNLLMAAAATLTGASDRPLAVDWQLLADPRALAFPVLLAFVLPAAEEIGLRGWYLDRLHERFSITAAALLNGVTWAVWHAPFVWFPGYYDNTAFDPALSWWLPKIVLDAVLISWVYFGTNRSILAALIFHGMMNLTGEVLGVSADMYPFMLIGSVVAAATVMSFWKRHPPVAPRPPARSCTATSVP